MEKEELLKSSLDLDSIENYSGNESENEEQEDEENEISEKDCQTDSNTSQKSVKHFKNNIGIIKILSNRSSYHDINIRCSGDERHIPVNRLVLAAASTLFRECLPDVDEDNQILVADCSFDCLSLVVQYIYTGSICASSIALKYEVENTIDRLNIGQISHEKQLKNEPNQVNVPFIKTEPERSTSQTSSCDEESNVENFFHFMTSTSPENESQRNKRKTKYPQKKCKEWEDDVDFKDLFSDKNKQKIKKENEDIGGEFKCSFCGKSYSKQQRLDDHMTKHTGEKLKCKYCPKFFDRPGLRRVHEQLHTKPFKCTECDASFGRKSNLIGHQRIHRGERPYICDICGSGFPIQSSLLTHKKQSHPEGAKPWFCEFCENRFVSKSQLEIHRRVHTGEKPWICDTCGRGFTTKQNMLDHTRLHNDKMDYCCNKCGQQFKWKQSLERHLMDHTGVRPNPCDQCKLTFKTSNSLKKHKLSVHSDIKHFACQHCGSRFSTSSGVLRHQKKQRCSAMKPGIGDTAIKATKLLNFLENQNKNDLPPSSQESSKEYTNSPAKVTSLPGKQRSDTLQYMGSVTKDEPGTSMENRMRPELLQYFGATVKQEHPIHETRDSMNGRFRDAESERVMQSLQSIQYLNSVHNPGPPLSLVLPRHQVDINTDAERQHKNSSDGQPQDSYRLHESE